MSGDRWDDPVWSAVRGYRIREVEVTGLAAARRYLEERTLDPAHQRRMAVAVLEATARRMVALGWTPPPPPPAAVIHGVPVYVDPAMPPGVAR